MAKKKLRGTTIEKLTDIIRKGFRQVDRRFDATDRSVERLAQITARGFEEVDKRFGGVDLKFEEVGRRFDRIERTLETHSKILEGHGNAIHGVKRELKSFGNRVFATEIDIATLKKR